MKSTFYSFYLASYAGKVCNLYIDIWSVIQVEKDLYLNWGDLEQSGKVKTDGWKLMQSWWIFSNVYYPSPSTLNWKEKGQFQIWERLFQIGVISQQWSVCPLKASLSLLSALTVLSRAQCSEAYFPLWILYLPPHASPKKEKKEMHFKCCQRE